jgi:lipopolysaccharide export system protein LptC
MRLSRLKFVFIALGLAAVTLWITQQQSNQQTLSDESTPIASYSWQSQHSTTWQIDRQTPHKQTLIYTQQMNYQDTSKRSDFLQPNVRLLDLQQQTQIQSQQGFSEQNQIIHFEKDVRITQHNPTETAEAGQNKTLTTQRITYNAQSNLVSTDAAIVITLPQGTLTGTGLNANLQTGHYQILSHVKGVYQPQTTP